MIKNDDFNTSMGLFIIAKFHIILHIEYSLIVNDGNVNVLYFIIKIVLQFA